MAEAATEWAGGRIGSVEVRCACGSNRVVSTTHRNRKGQAVKVVWTCRDCDASHQVDGICRWCGEQDGHHRSWCRHA